LLFGKFGKFALPKFPPMIIGIFAIVVIDIRVVIRRNIQEGSSLWSLSVDHQGPSKPDIRNLSHIFFPNTMLRPNTEILENFGASVAQDKARVDM
jgi:hypothetical protein